MLMHVTSGSHFWPKMDKKGLLSLVLGPLMIGLSCLPQSLLAGSAEGKTIFQQKCVACHTIGGGRLVGPDLKGVSSRQDSAWLVRWIQEPDKMLAEGDPIATAQLKEYHVPMPALGVSEAQAKDILAYIGEAEGGAAPAAAPTAAPIEEAVAEPASPENGKNIFEKTCSACHTIGQGAGVGPDLKGVTSRRDITWLLRWIQEPDKMRAEGDSIATRLLEEHQGFPMPNYALSENDARDLLGYIAAESGEKAPIPPPDTTSKSTIPPVTTPASDGDAAIGRAYFIGGKRFRNGGPACISCHGNADIPSLGGGSLGPDLTKVHLRMGGDIGLKSVIQSTPFPTMQGIFSKKPVTEEEATHLIAYFAQTKDLTEKELNFKIVGISFGGFLFMYILFHLIWRNRLTGVRKPLVGR
jgi:mono/diheme cytochrome c family protein